MTTTVPEYLKLPLEACIAAHGSDDWRGYEQAKRHLYKLAQTDKDYELVLRAYLEAVKP